MNEETRQLFEDGFCLFRNAFDQNLITKLRTVTDRLLDSESAEEQARKRYQGSSLSVRYQDPVFGD